MQTPTIPAGHVDVARGSVTALARKQTAEGGVIPGTPTWETTPETYQVVLWHPEEAPDGETFIFPVGFDGKHDGPTEADMADDGWVDNPGKIGSNPWGAKDAIIETIAQRKADYEAGALPAIDEPVTVESIVKLRTLTAEQEELLEQAKKRQSDLEAENKRLEEELAAYQSMRTPQSATDRDRLQQGQEEHALADAQQQAGRPLDPDSIPRRDPRGRKRAADPDADDGAGGDTGEGDTGSTEAGGE